MFLDVILRRFSEASANAATPSDVYAALRMAAEGVIGARLFTVMAVDAQNWEARRLYSSMPDAYPVQGTKPIQDNEWSDKVLGRQEIFVANTIEAIAEVFPDFELIQSLGCESVLNLPIVISGQVLGTLNCLHEMDFYTPEKVKAASALELPGAVSLLWDKLHTEQGGQ